MARNLSYVSLALGFGSVENFWESFVIMREGGEFSEAEQLCFIVSNAIILWIIILLEIAICNLFGVFGILRAFIGLAKICMSGGVLFCLEDIEGSKRLFLSGLSDIGSGIKELWPLIPLYVVGCIIDILFFPSSSSAAHWHDFSKFMRAITSIYMME